MAFNPNFPTGLDRGDGVTVLPKQPLGSGGAGGTFGTPTPPEARQTSSQTPQEDPSSPDIERGEQGTIVHQFNLNWNDGLDYLPGLGRGTYLQDSAGNTSRVLTTRLKSVRGDQAQLTVTAESISFDTPPDEFSITPSDLGADIIKHPRYFWALNPTSTDSNNFETVGSTQVSLTKIKSDLIRMIQTYRDTPMFPSNDYVNGLIQSTIMAQLSNGTVGFTTTVDNPHFDPTKPAVATQAYDGFPADIPAGNSQLLSLFIPYDPTNITDGMTIAIAATKEIISKLWRQEDVPYFPTFEVRFSQYFFAPPFLNPGGYIEDARDVVPEFFFTPYQGTLQTVLARGDFGSSFSNLDTVQPQGFTNASIFDNFPGINPQSFSSDRKSAGAAFLNISSLRKADELEYQRTWFRKTSTWIIALNGHFDPDLYTESAGPQVSTDFDQLIA